MAGLMVKFPIVSADGDIGQVALEPDDERDLTAVTYGAFSGKFAASFIVGPSNQKKMGGLLFKS
jgi:hypothetical protein